MPKRSKQTQKAQGNPATKTSASERAREAVLEDFRKIVGPLRGHNRDQKPKS